MNALIALVLIVAVGCGCGNAPADGAPEADATVVSGAAPGDGMNEAMAAPAAPAQLADGEMRPAPKSARRAAAGPGAARKADAPMEMMERDKKESMEPVVTGDFGAEGGGGGAGPAAPTRAWFPETFLFAPRVITSDAGEAIVEALVPDRLTTWRVLALAHSRSGMQAGTVASLVSNLPVSVDVVVPPYLVSGDRVALPIQVVNTTAQALSRALTTKAEGGRLKGSTGALTIAPGGTATSYAWVDVGEPGELLVEAAVGSDDAVRRTVPVESGGEPKRVERSGTLAAKRTFSLALGADVLPGSARASLQVFPGALAILRAELLAASERASLDDDGFLLALTGRAHALAAQLKAPLDDDQLVRLTRVATQRAARHARSPDLFTAMKLAPGALLHGQDTLMGRNGEHLAAFVARAQRPDGTFAGGDGWPLQRLVVSTAEALLAVRAADHSDDVKRRAAAASLRARGAFERFGAQIDDPYTAAVVLGTGVVESPLKDELERKITAALVQGADGARSLPVPDGVVRADGSRPSDVEATARALWALRDHAPSAALLPDLGAFVLSAYRPGVGFGDGATNRIALEAVALIFRDPLPQRVVVSLLVDGKSVGADTLEGARLQEVMTLDAAFPAPRGDAPLAIEVQADPPVPGLSYVVTLDYAVPWPAPPADAGIELTVALGKLSVGVAADVKLTATAPGGSPLVIRHGLPAGVDPVKPSLDALVASGTITSFVLAEGVVELSVPARTQGELFEATYQVVPTLAGTLHPRVASARALGRDDTHFPTPPWTIGR